METHDERITDAANGWFGAWWLALGMPRIDRVLRWTAGPEGTTYGLRLTTEDLAPLVEVLRLEQPEYRVDPRVLEGIPQGDAVLWRVTAHLPDGRRVASRTFTTPLE